MIVCIALVGFTANLTGCATVNTAGKIVGKTAVKVVKGTGKVVKKTGKAVTKPLRK